MPVFIDSVILRVISHQPHRGFFFHARFSSGLLATFQSDYDPTFLCKQIVFLLFAKTLSLVLTAVPYFLFLSFIPFCGVE